MSRRVTLSLSSTEERERFTVGIIGDPSVGKLTLYSRLYKDWNELGNTAPRKGKKPTLGIYDRDLIAEIVVTSTKKKFPIIENLPVCDVYLLVYSLVKKKSFHSACAVREQIVEQRGPSVPILFVGNKTDIAGAVNKAERSYRHKVITSEWKHGHEEISAEQDVSVNQVLQQIVERFHKYQSHLKEQAASPLKRKLMKMKKKFLSRNGTC